MRPSPFCNALSGRDGLTAAYAITRLDPPGSTRWRPHSEPAADDWLVEWDQTAQWGLYDTLGGVWEWCWDLYGQEVYGPYRIIRGGGWSDPHWSCRAGVRRKTSPQASFDDLGFRLARNSLSTMRSAGRDL